MTEEPRWKRLGEDCFDIPLSKLRGRLPLGYEVIEAESSNAIMLQVGKGTMFCGRPVHHTYWKFHGWVQEDEHQEPIAYFGDWHREDEMAPGWGGPATVGFGLFFDDEESDVSIFDEEAHETDWEQAYEELPYIIEEIIHYLGERK